IHRPDGSVRWILARGAVETDNQNRPVGVRVACRDVTATRRATETAQRLAAIVRFSGDAMFAKSLDGTILEWNPAAERVYGWRAEEIVGRSVSLLVPPEAEDEARATMERIRRGERVAYEAVRLRKDGTRIDVAVTVSPVRDPLGRILGASTTVRDIS